MQPPNTGRWCTREELIKLTMAQTPLKFTVQELTEVMRGKKHKSALGVESMKKDGEYHHRFVRVMQELFYSHEKACLGD